MGSSSSKGSCAQREGHRNLQNNVKSQADELQTEEISIGNLQLMASGMEKLCTKWWAQAAEKMKVEAEAATGSSQMMPSQKAAAYLQVLKPINQSHLRWIENGVLYNMKYDDGNLVIQQPGLYFIYCHLHFFIPSCPNKTSDLKLDIHVNGKTMKQTLFTLCSCEKTSEKTYHDLFQVLLIELEKGHRIAVNVQGFEYVETDGSPSSNVLGAFKYSGEDWGYSLFRTVGQNGL